MALALRVRLEQLLGDEVEQRRHAEADEPDVQRRVGDCRREQRAGAAEHEDDGRPIIASVASHRGCLVSAAA